MTRNTATPGGHEIEISHPDKVIFPDSGITKSDLVGYYQRIASTALPHWRDRPATLQRFPDGIGETGFFQKNVPEYFPDWIDRRSLPAENGHIDYLLVNDAATAAYLANQGCVSLHLGLSRVDRIDHPDRMIFDLDPPNGGFARVQSAARILKDLLEDLELKAYVQTTGSRGLHLLVPLDRSADFQRVHEFSRRLATAAATAHPDLLTVEQRKNKRGNRVFVDYLRNSYGQTAVAAYSIRPLPEAPIATPLEWREALRSDMTSRRFHIGNIFRRLGQKPDPWADLNHNGQSLRDAEERLATLENH